MTAPIPLRPDPADMPADHDSLCPCGVCVRGREALGHVTLEEYRRRTAQRDRLLRVVEISKGRPV